MLSLNLIKISLLLCLLWFILAVKNLSLFTFLVNGMAPSVNSLVDRMLVSLNQTRKKGMIVVYHLMTFHIALDSIIFTKCRSPLVLNLM